MTQSAIASIDARLQAALDKFGAAGFLRRAPALLLPAGIFLDRLGEEFRGKLYLTGENGGSELCLRPEFTIPVALQHLASPSNGEEADIAYGGPVFRAGEGELFQTGVESFGRKDPAAADAEILGVALEAAAAAGAPRLMLRLGDVGLSRSFLARLELPPAWRRRIETGVARGAALEAVLAPAPRQNGALGAGVRAALEKSDAASARQLVEDLLAIAGAATVGGRSAAEVAERFLEQASLQEPLNPRTRQQIVNFFAVEASPDAASERLRALARDSGLKLDEALEAFETRTSFLAARGVKLEETVFSTRFPHAIGYYSGFMFEARPSGAGVQGAPLLSGGRYDGLLKSLGAQSNIPAVGAAIFVDRLGAVS
ncbi:ATP phosphoribosyltransferase regulatory subunit [Methylocystis bryophila]|uniref:ATP phosphoribosyltransferase regulatory subunit n=1 Tax=Methylocystis bryophila TaxID=655015 RepID=UPI0018F80CE2|nr:ATP phosphoribosyltransferase regulatory subunit [Methylocystis bryophila]BDV40056.1 ATP phosphoribosyltransferase regulatory subunit [Methylocystis bryophila]